MYTGLSSFTFFTLIAMLVAGYYILKRLVTPPSSKYVPMEPLPPPVQLGTISEEQLKAFDGTDPKKPLLMAIKGIIYDVSESRFVDCCVRFLVAPVHKSHRILSLL